MMTTDEERRKSQRENQNYFSGKISDLSRTISFGLAALGFTFMSTDSQFYTQLTGMQKQSILFAATTGCFAVVFDYLQYLFGYWAAGSAAENKEGGYNPTSVSRFWRLLQNVSFYAKQALAVLGCIVLLYALTQRLLF